MLISTKCTCSIACCSVRLICLNLMFYVVIYQSKFQQRNDSAERSVGECKRIEAITIKNVLL